MSEDDFRKLCNTYGFAPSRALRELIDCATARAEAQRDALLEALRQIVGQHGQWNNGMWAANIARAAIAKAEGGQ